MLTNIGAFVVVLGVMIFFHEFGHFITAKAFGMRVFVFSFGFGKRLFGFHWGETDCRVSAIPLGGYVKLEGEPDDKLSQDTSALGDGRDFTTRPRWQRILVYLAGPAMNAVLTIGVMTTLYVIGFQVDATLFDRPIVGAVEKGSPAESAGLQPGDEIVAIDDTPVATWEAAHYGILIRPETDLVLRVVRGGTERRVPVRTGIDPKEKIGTLGTWPLVRIGSPVAGQPAEAAGLQADDAILRVGDRPIRTFGEIVPIVMASAGKPLTFDIWREGTVRQIVITPADSGQGPKIGIAPRMVEKRFAFSAAVGEALDWTWLQTRQTFEIIGRLLSRQISPKTMMGPLGIAKASGDAARAGVDYLFYLVAIISLQVGIMNLFPMPPLDGGHLAVLVGESLLRRDFSVEAKTWIMNAGAMVLFLLIGLVLYADLSKTAWLGKYLP